MYKNANLSPEERAKDLLSKMTVDEKIDQMTYFRTLKVLRDKFNDGHKLQSKSGAFGNFKIFEDPDEINKIQDYFLNETRLGIPLLTAWESLHGFWHPNGTAFPQTLGLACSFNPDLVEKMAEVIGKEARAVGVRQVFAPDVDIPRDPRWGRMQETYGEDPYLSGEMGAAYVRGVQKQGVVSTVKHYIGYGVPEGGINLATAHLGEREIREVMLEPFKKCVDAGVMSVMPSYNDIDGIPVHANKKLLRGILRDELGFEGTTISDWDAVQQFRMFHFIAKDDLTAGKMALSAGVDVESPSAVGYGADFRAAAKNGKIDMALIDEAVLRVLTLKFKLGLFENPYNNHELLKEMHSKESVELARVLDEQSILLLKNDGILPLDEEKCGKVAVIGNNAFESFPGDYIGYNPEHFIDFLNGMKLRLGDERVLYAKGCDPIIPNNDLLTEAVEVAKQADVIFLSLGDEAVEGGGIGGGRFKNTQVTCGEGYDTTDLNFPPSQKQLFDEIVKLGKPVVLIMYAGRPFTIMNEVEKVNAYMHSFGAGEQSGVAFANLIFGDKTPSAKLSVSFPQSNGHIPCYYNHKTSARGNLYMMPGSLEKPGRDYITSTPDAWLPFGFGLSYNEIKYQNLTAKTENGKVFVSVEVENCGKYEIDESVLLFVKMLYCPITPFVKKLRAFKKANLKPGEKKTVEFVLSDEDFTYIDENMQTAVNHGKHKILIDNLECEIEF